ncbi:hypothetical protein O0235_10670 [Tepidiforma flava]|uniref:Uncharacterized protein n=1 Tax=Tepidiforma flava TaxID=3004094 RepID=A0ABY7M3X1_9CHLR|nr:hypothetical protein [Tepidiforma flava]WBL35249.1 hypothetical protein O0235_10670 [Tepidiforma flava]
MPPATASVVAELELHLGRRRLDAAAGRGEPARPAELAIYEVHLGSWRRGPGGEMLTYRELAPQLAEDTRLPTGSRMSS